METQIPIPIAIVGMACRFPGGGNSPDELWEQVLENGRSGWSDVPASRYNWKSFYHPNQDASGAHNARGGHFLDQDVSEFDANFFGIPAAEANAIDPQQRLHLETAYEALENAGIPVESVKGSDTSVYVAVVSRDYDRMIYNDPTNIPKYHLTGCGDATACGRISYVFDFKGPSMTIDTGCSGSMVGLHQACQSLRLGESSMALVGGVNLLLSPDMTIAMSMLHMLNDDGMCYSFDSRGSGYGRSEGVATIVLKRLDDALRDGDPIRSVIRNSGVNSDGRTNGILLPSLTSQENLIKTMFKSAGLDPNKVGYVEAHGTGTVAGDSTELSSINNAFCGVGRKSPLFVGSIKANIGHPESSSGLAGVIKACLIIEKGLIPPIPNIQNLKESLHLEDRNIKIPQKLETWPLPGVRMACVNSFGFGGTNSHVILSSQNEHEIARGDLNRLDGASATNGNNWYTTRHNGDVNEYSNLANGLEITAAQATVQLPQLLVLSAKSKSSLLAIAENLRGWVLNQKQGENLSLQDLAYTLSKRRSMMVYRATFVAANRDNIHEALQTIRISKATTNFRISWLFTGQGAQYFNMARELIDTPIFRQSLASSEKILRNLGTSWALVEELKKEGAESRINESEISQPATTAIQIALVDLLHNLGIFPNSVLGHSSGEIAAAYGAGILSQESALKVSYHRSFISSWCREEIKQKGAMIAVGLGEEDVSHHISKIRIGTAVVACVNSPTSTTVSGDQSAIEELQQILDGCSIFNRKLKVDTAYHSHHMKAVADRYLRSLETIKVASQNPSVKFFSSVTGKEKTLNFGASYWVENLVSKVRFSDALQNLTISHGSLPTQIFLELGPHSALQGPVRQSLSPLKFDPLKQLYMPTLVRDKHAQIAILELAGKLFEHGYPVDLQASNAHSHASSNQTKVLHNLPSYAWSRENYWHESRLSREYRFREHPHHDLLGLRIVGGNRLEPTWRNILSIDALPWLNEHIIDNFALFPGSGFLCMAMEAMRQIIHDRKISGTIKRFVMRDVSFSKALVIPESPGKIEVQLSFRQLTGSGDKTRTPWEDFCVTGLTSDGKMWNEHCRGSIMVEFLSNSGENETWKDENFADVEAQDEENHMAISARARLRKMETTCSQNIDSTSLYQELRLNGIDYGSTFASIRNLHIGPCEAIGTVVIPDVAACMPAKYMQDHVIHPATFDALMHIVLPLYARHCSAGPVMLTSIGEVTVAADIFNVPGQELLVACSLHPAGPRSGTVDVSVFQGVGEANTGPVVTLSREEFRGLGESAAATEDRNTERDSTYHIDWVSASTSGTSSVKGSGGPIRIVCDMNTFNRNLALEISAAFSKANDQAALVSWSSMNIENGAIYVVLDSASNPLLSEPSPLQSRQINTIFKTVTSVVWITVQDDRCVPAKPEKELIRGLARMARIEHKGLQLITLEVQCEIEATMLVELISRVNSISSTSIKNCGIADHDYIYKNDELFVPRMILDESFNSFAAALVEEETADMGLFLQTNRPLKIHIETPGLLESLIFVDDEIASTQLPVGQIIIEVYAHSVNQTDVSIALGRAHSQMVGECAGLICGIGSDVPSYFKIGDRVIGWSSSSPYGSYMRLDHRLVQKLPDSLSFVEGASIPYAFETAYYGLIEIANLQNDQSVLIHSAAGGVGQAAILLAQNIGAEVFVTVSSSSKRQLLIEKFGIPKSNVFSSRSKTFKQGIARATRGNGVDVVLNTLADNDALHDTLECVSRFGTFINIGSLSGQLSVKPFASSVTFSSINMGLMAQHQPAKVGRLLEKVIAMFEANLLRPIYPLTALPMTQISDAFKIIQHKKHNGKVVLTVDKTTLVKQKTARLPSLQLEKTSRYLIAASETTNVHMVIQVCQFLVSRGAEHVMLILESHKQETGIASTLEIFDDKVEVIVCDITHRKKIRAVTAGLGDVKGVIQMSSSRNERGMLDPSDYQLDGTRFLAEGLSNAELDFFIAISSLTDALGLGQNYGDSAGTAFQQAFANMQANPKTHYMSLSIGDVQPSNRITHDFEQDRYSPQISTEEFHLLLEYSTGGAARKVDCHHLLMGLDKSPLIQYNSHLLEVGIFSTLKETPQSEHLQSSNVPKSISESLSMSKSLHDAQAIISAALTEQLSSLVALDVEDITLSLPIADIGLDSLIAIEFKNWIGRHLAAHMQTSEILDASNIQELANLILTRSVNVDKSLPSTSTQTEPPNGANSLISNGNGNVKYGGVDPFASNQSSADQSIIQTPTSTTPSPMLRLPRQPLPDLASTLQNYLTSVRSFCSPKDLEHTRTVIDEFQKPGGLGLQLQDRLLARYNDPTMDNWVAELYVASCFLERRVQLVPYSSFFFGHQLSVIPHTQAERAAIISVAAFKYKQLLEAGKIQSEILNEQPTCMELYQWIFNTSRKPCRGADIMERFPDNDYLIALKNGRAFKVMLTEGADNLSFEDMKRIFEDILDVSDEKVSWLGILTAEERNSWAEIREQIKEISKTNEKYLSTLEAACFVICLDNATPTNMVERAAHFHFGNGSNRWNDKSIQFIVCANAFSGFVGDHTMLDAGTVHGLNAAVNSAILDYRPSLQVNGHDKAAISKFEELEFTTTTTIDDHISRVRRQFDESITGIEHAFFTYNDFGSALLREHKAAPKSAFQLIVLLAAQDHFGYVPPLWETVSVSNFHQGRIEINQIVLPPVADFCAIAKNLTVPASVRRKLFFEAIKAHANSVTRASRGKGVDRHLSALRQVLREDEPVPALFKDPSYEKTRPRKIMAHCHETGMLEKGFVLRDPEAIWVHYELDEDEVRFAVTGTTGNTQQFCNLVQKNARFVCELLNSE